MCRGCHATTVTVHLHILERMAETTDERNIEKKYNQSATKHSHTGRLKEHGRRNEHVSRNNHVAKENHIINWSDAKVL